MAINFALKAKYAFYSTLVFFLVANPETFKMTERVFGWMFTIADTGGCPTSGGFFFHMGTWQNRRQEVVSAYAV